MPDYIIPAGYGEAEYVDKKSRFIGQVQHVESVSEAMAFIESVRSKYADATHTSGPMSWPTGRCAGRMTASRAAPPGSPHSTSSALPRYATWFAW